MAILALSQNDPMGRGAGHGKLCTTQSHAAAGTSDGDERLGEFNFGVAAVPASFLTDHGTCGGHSVRPS